MAGKNKKATFLWLTHFRGTRAVGVQQFMDHLFELKQGLESLEPIEIDLNKLKNPLVVDYFEDHEYIGSLIPDIPDLYRISFELLESETVPSKTA